MRKWIRRIWVAAGLAFSAYMFLSFQAWGVPEAILSSDGRIAVTNDSWQLSFRPARMEKRAGLIFYPGGLVDPVAYAPLARAVAERGFPAIVVKLPLRAAPLETQEAAVFQRTLERIRGEPEIQWVLAGHSRGGALAARFAQGHGRSLAALLLLGTTHPRDFDLSASELAVTKIYATQDRIARFEDMQKNRNLLPPDTRWVRIEGGNHSQFGWYGFQFLDGRAKISRREQQAVILDTILEVLIVVAARPEKVAANANDE